MVNHTPTTTGIYQIKNLLNGKIYIGSSIRIRNRWRQHRHLLRRGKHHSCHLQRSWDKHGESSFLFEVLEVCTDDNRIALEQQYLETLSPSFNICKVAASTAGVPSPKKGKKQDLTDAARFNMGAPWRGKSLPQSIRDKMSEVRTGRHHSEEWKNNIASGVKERHSNPTTAMIAGRAKVAKAGKEWRWVTNGFENRRVHQNDLEKLEPGFTRGRTILKKE